MVIAMSAISPALGSARIAAQAIARNAN